MSTFNGADSTHERHALFAVTSVFFFFGWATVFLRLWVRTIIIKNPGWDDVFLVFGAIAFSGFCFAVVVAETDYGGAFKVNTLTFPEIERLVLIIISSFCLYAATMVFLKISLGIFYLRIVIRDWQRNVVYVVVVLNTLWGITISFIAIFQCGGNVSKYLVHQLADVCLPIPDIYRIQLAAAILNALTDWTFAILPIFVLVKATMPLRTKLSAGFVLLLGCGGSVISLARIPYIKGLLPGPNFFQSAVDVGIFSSAELGLIVIAASAATLRPLVRVVRGRVHLASLRRSMRSSAHPGAAEGIEAYTIPEIPPAGVSINLEKSSSSSAKSSSAFPSPSAPAMDDLENQRPMSVTSMAGGSGMSNKAFAYGGLQHDGDHDSNNAYVKKT